MLTLYDRKKTKEKCDKPSGLSPHVIEAVFNTAIYANHVIVRLRKSVGTDALDLHSLHLTEKDVTTYVIPFLKANPGIKKLNICRNRVGDKGVEAIAGIDTIEELNIECNAISDVAATVLVRNTKIKKLDASFNLTTDIAAKTFAQSNTMECLNLAVNDIGIEGRDALLKNITFKHLNLAYNKKTAESPIKASIIKY